MNPNPKLFKDQKKKKKTIPMQQQHHLNGPAARTISRSSSISRSISSSSLSTQAPSSSSGTPSKSVHNSKTVRAATSSFRSVKVNRLKTNPLSLSLRHNSNIASKQLKKTLEEVKTTVEHDFTFTLTPSAAANNNKVVRIDEEVEEDSTSTTKNTPPVQISVSPEIQGGGGGGGLSISLNAAPATPSCCYGAGHLLSGVTDRRKCRPRGILAVGNSKSGCINGETKTDLHEFSTSSFVMKPLEASMRWLCSNGDQKDIPGLFSISSPSSCECEVVTLQEKKKETYPYDDDDDLHKGNNWSPFSIDSLCSDNMIQSPESYSIFNHYDDNMIQPSPEDSTGNPCSIDCSSMKEIFGSKLSLSLRDGINQFVDGTNYSISLSDDEDECRKSFGFGVMKGEELIPQQHKATIFAESLTINGDSISDMFSRSSTQS